MMKKLLLISITVLVLFGFASCFFGSPGETYIGYSWVYTPQYLSDNNPAVPSYIVNGTYYETEEGTFHMSYRAWNGSSYSADYTITADTGFLFMGGEPAYFEIALYGSGPTLYEWSEPRGMGTPSREAGVVYTEQKSIGGYTITLEFELIE